MLIFLILEGGSGRSHLRVIFVYNYHPLLLNGMVHVGIFISLLVPMYFVKKLNVRNTGLYLAGALPVHLAIHFMTIRDLAQLMGVSHFLLNFLSLP
jgi:hypothetical protein